MSGNSAELPFRKILQLIDVRSARRCTWKTESASQVYNFGEPFLQPEGQFYGKPNVLTTYPVAIYPAIGTFSEKAILKGQKFTASGKDFSPSCLCGENFEHCQNMSFSNARFSRSGCP